MWTPSSARWPGRFPENTVLSHDLLEACHARSALVSDVEFYEEYPSRYNVDIDRRHRWIRGDWQITQWLLPRVPGADARRIANPLSALSQWKIFDNLRRSLVPVALLLLLLGAWLLLPGLGGLGALLVLAIITLPGLLAALVDAVRKPADLPWAMHLRGVAALGRPAARPDFPHPGLSALRRLHQPGCDRPDAAAPAGDPQAAPRMADVERFRTDRARRPRRLLCDHVDRARSSRWRPALFLAAAHPAQLTAAAADPRPLAGGAVDRLVDQPAASRPPRAGLDRSAIGLSRPHGPQDLALLRNLRHRRRKTGCRRTISRRFPLPTIASRTSPTNMGLALLANLAARDFGYLSAGGLMRRTQDALATMQRLERLSRAFLQLV